MTYLKNLRRLIAKGLQQPAYALHAARMRLVSTMSYHLWGGRSAPPETISLLLTYRCNLRCRMCGFWGERGSLREVPAAAIKGDLGLSLIKGLIEEVKAFRPTITLFGGEPLLHHEWGEVLRVIKGAGLRCNMITNGILLAQRGEEAVRLGLDEVIFSLDGPAGVHDRIRGGEGVFQRALVGFQTLAEAKERYGKKLPRVNVNTVIWEENYNLLADIAEVAVGFGAETITFHHLIFIDKQAYEGTERIIGCSSPDWRGFVREQLPQIDPEVVIAQRRLLLKRSPIPAFFYPNYTDGEIRRYYSSFDFLPTSYRHRCLSPWMVAYVLPDGGVKPCLSLGYRMGDLKEQSFRDIWNGEHALTFRRLLKRERYFPVCPRCTEFCRF